MPISLVRSCRAFSTFLCGCILFSTGQGALAQALIFADGDVAPLGSPDSLVNAADLLVTERIVAGDIQPSDLTLSHGDVFPAGAPDGVIDIRDLLQIARTATGITNTQHIDNLTLFTDGPAIVGAELDGVAATTRVTAGGSASPGTNVSNNPNARDPDNNANRVWYFSVSGGTASAYLGSADLSSSAILDSSFDLSGSENGELVFDIRVVRIDPGTLLTVKIDSGQSFGQQALTRSDYSIGEWRRVSIRFADLLANPGPGNGLDLSRVVNPFVIEVSGGSAELYLDNIFITHRCATRDSCRATINTQPSTTPTTVNDSDNDGVEDIADRCPATPSNTLVDPNGCERAIPEGYVPLFNPATATEPVLQEETSRALITRFSDRARDRHARESQFRQYDHYLSHYWEHRTAAIEIVDTIPQGGNTITFNVTTQWPLHPREAELRFFFLGQTTPAQYFNNGVMSPVPSLDEPGSDERHYTRSLNFNPKEGRPLRAGDRLEFELSQFLFGVPRGRNNYYGTAVLYVVGEGIVPFEGRGPLLDSFPLPEAGRLGGDTTLNYQYSDEPDNHFIQMSTNLSHINGQVFVRGRRVHHTDFGNGAHNESVSNPGFGELAGQLGPHYMNRSCVSCHARNGRALPARPGQLLSQYSVLVGDEQGNPHPLLGSALQPRSTSGAAEGGISLARWTANNGLRSPEYAFTGPIPQQFSARLAPQLVGMGLLEAIEESDLEALADPEDINGDGISGRFRLVNDPVTGEPRIGRFGWKAATPSVKAQVAAALNTDIGVMTSVRPSPDCGSQQTTCGTTGAELADQHLDDLSAYIALLGVSARRNLNDAQSARGQILFSQIGCNSCHTESFQTSPFHPHAELRNQTIYPYTDLLLHDMGPGLASTLEESGATASEWRTPPLWNIGLTAGVSGGEAYLHDGRARTLTEAILWHGGEAEAIKQRFEALSAPEKAALIAFLKSL